MSGRSSTARGNFLERSAVVRQTRAIVTESDPEVESIYCPGCACSLDTDELEITQIAAPIHPDQGQLAFEAGLPFPGRHLLTVAFSVALAVPIVGLIVPEFFIVRDLGLFDTKVGLILFYSATFFPFSFVIQRAFLVSLPYEIEEAAMIDGADYLTILRKIVAPLALPGLATVSVLVFIFIWNESFFAQLLTISFGNLNIQVTRAEFRSAFQRDTTAQLAGTTIAMLVPITAFLSLQRYVIAGLTTGSSR